MHYTLQYHFTAIRNFVASLFAFWSIIEDRLMHAVAKKIIHIVLHAWIDLLGRDSFVVPDVKLELVQYEYSIK